MTVGERIKQRRIELGLSQEELARKMGYSGKSSVCKAETYGDSITTAKITKYAEALDVSEAYLMGWQERAEDRNTYADEVAHLRSKYPDIDFVKIDKMVEAYINAEPSIQKAIELMLKV